MIFYLDVCRKAKLEPGWINHEGFTKRSQQSSVGSMPTSMSMKERSTKTRKEKAFRFNRWGTEVDRMPINSVRSTLLNPHEHEKPGLVYVDEFTIEEKAHAQRLYIFLRSEDRSKKKKKKKGTVSK